MFDILLKFSLLNNFGAAYTLKSIDEESYQEIMYLQLCLNASGKAQEMANRKATYVSKEFA